MSDEQIAAPEQQTPEARRVEIASHPDWYMGGPKKAELLAEMQRLAADPADLVKQDQAKADAAAKLTPAEQAIATLRKSPAFYDAKHKDHDDVMRQYRSAVFRRADRRGARRPGRGARL
jgi:hypothetical protein